MPARFTSSFTTVDITAPSFVSVSPGAGRERRAGLHARPHPVLRADRSGEVPRAAVRADRSAGRDRRPAGLPASATPSLVFTPNLPLAEDSVVPRRDERRGRPRRQRAGAGSRLHLHHDRSNAAADPRARRRATTARSSRTRRRQCPPTSACRTTSPSSTGTSTTSSCSPTARSRSGCSFQATPDFGAPGGHIKVSAIAIDTSGNRGMAPVSADVARHRRSAARRSRSSRRRRSISARNGDRIVVDVQATDDVGLTQHRLQGRHRAAAGRRDARFRSRGADAHRIVRVHGPGERAPPDRRS